MAIERIRNLSLREKIMTADEAAQAIESGMTLATSGFTPAGHPKVVPQAIARRVLKEGSPKKLNLYTGASVGDELDGELARAGAIHKRLPYQTQNDMRKGINSGEIHFLDMHLSSVAEHVRNGFLGEIDFAIIEAVAITEEGYVIPSTSLGNTPVFVSQAKRVIIEVNTSQPEGLEGMHDVYEPLRPPHRKPIPLLEAMDRIGQPYLVIDPEKIHAVVMSDLSDSVAAFRETDEVSEKISHHLIAFLQEEVASGRLPSDLLPLQSGVGAVANAVLGGLNQSDFKNLTMYSEVIQDSVLDLLESGTLAMASASSLTLSAQGRQRFFANLPFFKDKIILRPQEISNHPEIVRRLGVISMNTAIEVDIFGHVNSTNIMGTKMMNGIGGSGDFTRNAYISIFSTPSTAKDGKISSIVPMVSHCDHTEHDVQIVITEQGVADLRGLSPRERATKIIENCAHPDYKEALWAYVDGFKRGGHVSHDLENALSWHVQFLKTGSMKD